MMQPEDIKRMIESGLPGARVSVTGDGHHFDARHPWRAPLRGALKRVQFCSGQNCEAEVISSEFVGKTMLQQHQIVYHTLGGKMGNEIHALSLRTQAPGE